MAGLILIEFNELCPSLLDKWMAEGLLPNFKRLYDRSKVFVTEADESEPPYLEPWIQWFSLHTGVPFREHKVFHLTDGPRCNQVDIWQRLLQNGKTVWNCSSMNARALNHPSSVFLPDPWCLSESPYPAELRRFHRFVSKKVQEYTNADQRITLAETFGFLHFLITHGLRFKTVCAVLSQIWLERTSSDDQSWKRAPLLDKMLFDVFQHYYLERRPDFATYFVNSTAHLQHSYWRCMQPEPFTVKPTEDESRCYRDAIQFGYREMDGLIGDFMALAGRSSATLMFATALSQQPYLKYEAIGGHNFYRPRQVESLLAELDIQATVFPVMTHQYQLRFADQRSCVKAQRKLAGISCNGQQIFECHRDDSAASLYFGCQIKTMVPKDAQIRLGDGSGRNMSFFDVFYRIDEIKSGRHHPDGCLWLQSDEHARHPGKVSILDVVPTILGQFGLLAPELKGRDLLAARVDRLAS